MQKEISQVKVVLLGDSGVGKSSIVLRFVADTFHNNLDPTIGASFLSKAIEVENHSIKFSIWDTAGQERYHSLARMYYADAAAAVLVYDITNRASYDAMKHWRDELGEFGPKNLVVAIAGNKEDLIEKEEVDFIEAKAYADSIGAIYRKTSAKTKYGVDQLFKDIAYKITVGSEPSNGGQQQSQEKPRTISIARDNPNNPSSPESTSKKGGCC
ncbi:unnamed protein product [Blepharisma stoltei]|uniref:Uncharacterized protein n=1 Tax=Blepharisma stoltei TaxID=1481888 RepID=A0AAU9JCG7_9CILI|nr:unnamed protein product [Blepharisma stoltei]